MFDRHANNQLIHDNELKLETTLTDYGDGISVDELLASIRERYQENPAILKLLDSSQLKNIFEKISRFDDVSEDLEKLPDAILAEALFLCVHKKGLFEGGAFIDNAILYPDTSPLIQKIIRKLDPALLHKVMIASHIAPHFSAMDSNYCFLTRLIDLAANEEPKHVEYVKKIRALLTEVIDKLPQESLKTALTSQSVQDVSGIPIKESGRHIENFILQLFFATPEHFQQIMNRVNKSDLAFALKMEATEYREDILGMQAEERLSDYISGYTVFHLYVEADPDRSMTILEKTGSELADNFIQSVQWMGEPLCPVSGLVYAQLFLPAPVFVKLIECASPIALLRSMDNLQNTFCAADGFEASQEVALKKNDPEFISRLFSKIPEEAMIKISEALVSQNANSDNDYLAFFRLGQYAPGIFIKSISKTSQPVLDQLAFYTCENGRSGLDLAATVLPPEVFIKLVELVSVNAINLILLRRDSRDPKKRPELLWIASTLENDDALRALLQKADSHLIDALVDGFSHEDAPLKSRIKRLLSPEEEKTDLLEEKNCVDYKSYPEKSLDDLLSELRESNQHNPDIITWLDNGLLEKIIVTVDNFSMEEKDSEFHSCDKPITQWELDDIKAWADHIKKFPEIANNIDALPEIFAVITRAIHIESGYKPRKSQLIAATLFVLSEERGLLNQIATGEGKSDIVAILSIIKVLRGHKVDVVTSSPILAARDAVEKKSLYGMFGITVDDNWEMNPDKNSSACCCNPKECYEKDIVYGDLFSFSWDYLRDETKRCIGRMERPFDTVIVDEVDSMCVDGFDHIAILSGATPAMEYLGLLLVSVWEELGRIEQVLDEEKMDDFKTRKECIEKILKSYLTDLINNSPTHVPVHLKEFANYQIDHWIESAIQARYEYVNGREYVISENNEGHKIIAPVDYHNTGVVSRNLIWENGLHQFLQIKEGLSLRAEDIFNSFISNVSYFSKYENRVYGMTGTMGDANTQKLLNDVYPVSLGFVPTFRQKQFDAREGVLANDRKEWLDKIIQSAEKEVNAGRSVLIICENINEVDAIHEKLSYLKESASAQIECYSRNDTDECKAVGHIAEPKQILIATNLAGRGTDLKLSHEVKANGGLHVIVTFMPDNQRVEDQALGRAARQGDPGSGELIVNKDREIHKLNSRYPLLEDVRSIDELRVWRDQAEAVRIEEVRSFELPKLTLRDKLFKQYIEMMNELISIEADSHHLNEASDLWSFWLLKMDDELTESHKNDSSARIDEAEILRKFEIFKNEMLAWYASPQNMENPCLLTSRANRSQMASSMAFYDMAIQKDRITAVQAFYNRAFKRLSHEGMSAAQAAIDDLVSVMQIIDEEIIPQLEKTYIEINLNPKQVNGNSDTSKDIIKRIELYRKQINHIDASIKQIQSFDVNSQINITESSELSEFYLNANLSKEIEREIWMTGLEDFYQMEKIKENDDGLFGSFVIAVLGVMQIVVGVALIVGGMPIIGTALISEGVGDLIHAARTAIEGRCSLDEYMKSKATSMAITIITMGIDTIKAARAVQASAGKEAAKQLTKEQLKQIAKEAVKTAVIQSGIKEVLNFGLEYLTREALKAFEDDIEDAVRSALLSRLNDPSVSEAADKILCADRNNGNLALQKTMRQLALNILQSKPDAGKVAVNILKGVLARQHAGISAVIRLADIAHALDQIIHLTGSCADDFANMLKLSAHSLPPATQDMSQERNAFYESLVKTITNILMPALHKKVVMPAVQMVAENHINELAGKIQKATFSAHTEMFSKLHPDESKTEMVESDADRLFKKSRQKLRELGDEIDHLNEWTGEMQEKNMRLHELTGNPVIRGNIGPIVSTVSSFEEKHQEVLFPAHDSHVLQSPQGIEKSISGFKDKKTQQPSFRGIESDVDELRQLAKSRERGPDDFLRSSLIHANPEETSWTDTMRLAVYNNKIDFLYRGDARPPFEGIFEAGFKSFGDNKDILRHVQDSHGDSFYISTSKLKHRAVLFGYHPELSETYIYQINPQSKGIDIPKYLVSVKNSILAKNLMGYRTEQEVAVPKSIKSRDIKGAWRITIKHSPTDDIYFNSEDGRNFKKPPYISNPHYKPPSTFLATQWVGRGLIAVGLAVDGIELYNAFAESKETGDYSPAYHTTAEISGGWGAAFAASAAAAKTGALICAPVLPPYGSAFCGLTFGIAGGASGYMIGRKFAGETYENLANPSDKKSRSKITDINDNPATLFYSPQKGSEVRKLRPAATLTGSVEQPSKVLNLEVRPRTW